MGIGILGLAQLVIVLVLSFFALGLGISFAVRPSETKLNVLRPLSLALAFSPVGMFCAGSANTLAFASRLGFADPQNLQMMLGGLSEAMLPGAIAYSILAVTWALAAVGFHRMK